MRGSLRIVLYAAALGTVSAGLLTLAAEATRPYRRANEAAEKIRHILGVLDVPFDEGAAAAKLMDIFKENVREVRRSGLKTYEYRDPDAPEQIKAVAVAFEGQGLWGPIKGFLALSPDLGTIRGITFHEQEETPGLGGEIAAACRCGAIAAGQRCPAWFRHQFEGKPVRDGAGRLGIRIRSGVKGPIGGNEVDAITGATMTSQKVSTIINTVIRKIAEEGGND